MDQQTAGRSAQTPDRRFFMSLRDIGFWIRSARADGTLAGLRKQHGTREAFNLLYQATRDPYGAMLPYYRYQSLKYERLLALLPDRRYASALDIGCGLGILTRQLAARSDTVLGVDFSDVAVDQASSLSLALPSVRYHQADILELDRKVTGRYELVVLADVLYYLSPLSDAVLKSIREMVSDVVAPGGTLLLVNHSFFRIDADSRLTRQMHDCYRWSGAFEVQREQWYPFFLASVLQKRA